MVKSFIQNRFIVKEQGNGYVPNPEKVLNSFKQRYIIENGLNLPFLRNIAIVAGLEGIWRGMGRGMGVGVRVWVSSILTHSLTVSHRFPVAVPIRVKAWLSRSILLLICHSMNMNILNTFEK